MRTLSVRLPDPLDRRLVEEARDEGKSRSEFAREAIAEYVARRERQRFLAALAEESREMRADPEVRRIGEDFLAPENEALEAATGPPPGESERWWD